jgi:hypothetical protein
MLYTGYRMLSLIHSVIMCNRPAPVFDLNHKAAREEVKVLVEDYMAKMENGLRNYQDTDGEFLGTKVIELIIGSYGQRTTPNLCGGTLKMLLCRQSPMDPPRKSSREHTYAFYSC